MGPVQYTARVSTVQYDFPNPVKAREIGADFERWQCPVQAFGCTSQFGLLPLRFEARVASESFRQSAVRPAIGVQRENHSPGIMQPDRGSNLLNQALARSFRHR